MKYIFRGLVMFEYIPTNHMGHKVIQHFVEDGKIAVFSHCCFIAEDYKLLGEFFTTVYRHIQGEDVELKDIKVS